MAQLLGAGLVMLILVVFATGRLSSLAASREAIDDAVATTEVPSRSVAEPSLPPGLVDCDPRAVDRVDRTVLSRLLVDDVQRIKIWSADGTILYSDETRLIGERFNLGPAERAALRNGGQDGRRGCGPPT
ncbi:MAG: hypothetical protein ACR2HA_14025 [Nocardioides sp.]